MAIISTDVRAGRAYELDLWQARMERWRRVRSLVDRAELAEGRLRRECAQAAASELQLLDGGESLWIFPGAARVAELRRAIAGGELSADTAAALREVVRLLELYGDGAIVGEIDPARVVGYFDVLVVGDGARLDAPAWRGPSVGWLAVPSLEEALVAARCNPWVEAIALGTHARRFAARPTGLLTVEERRLLGALAGPDPIALDTIDGPLRELLTR